jgi:putative ATPase
MRGSDPDAALAWFARLIYAGVDPRIIVRRLIVHASEDVGLANPLALLQAVAASQALETVGMPEARIPIAQAIIAVSESPKSNSVVSAIAAAAADAQKGGFQPVPLHLRDTSYKGHERIQSGLGYKYPHDYPGHYVKQRYAPLESSGMPYYLPSDQGQEAKIAERRKLRGMDDG